MSTYCQINYSIHQVALGPHSNVTMSTIPIQPTLVTSKSGNRVTSVPSADRMSPLHPCSQNPLQLLCHLRDTLTREETWTPAPSPLRNKLRTTEQSVISEPLISPYNEKTPLFSFQKFPRAEFLPVLPQKYISSTWHSPTRRSKL